MDKAVFHALMDMEETIREDQEYQALLREWEALNTCFLQQYKTMTPQQQAAVMDYCGLLIEMHWKVLEYAVKRKNTAV